MKIGRKREKNRTRVREKKKKKKKKKELLVFFCSQKKYHIFFFKKIFQSFISPPPPPPPPSLSLSRSHSCLRFDNRGGVEHIRVSQHWIAKPWIEDIRYTELQHIYGRHERSWLLAGALSCVDRVFDAGRCDKWERGRKSRKFHGR